MHTKINPIFFQLVQYETSSESRKNTHSALEVFDYQIR